MKNWMLSRFRSILNRFANARQSGVALVITMMVMLTLILISLSLVMQSNTEHLISQNEQDSFHALSDGEGVIDYANRDVRTYILTVRPANLTPILQGALNSSNRPYLVGFKNILNPGIGRSGLDNTNEETTSGVATGVSGYGANDEWEVFRLGVDENADGLYDGNIRTVVYARLYDDYDSSSNPPILDSTDTDLRMKLEVRTIYPVYVDSSGVEVVNAFGGNVIATRGQSERHLTGRFGPLGSTAIRTDGNLDMHGSLTLCGECGSAHANGVMEYSGSPAACGSITGTAGFDYGGGTILGDSGTSPAVYIPILNPYNDLFVPDDLLFNTSTDNTLPSWLRCGGPTQYDPGNSKYFALVRVTGGTTHIYKGYRNWGDTTLANTKWVWRLIGDSSAAGNINDTRLDNCGRVVTCQSGVSGCSADEISTDNGVTWNPVSITSAVDGSGNNEWYNFNPDNSTNTDACYGTVRETILNTPYIATVDGSGTDQNDWNANDFSQFSGNARAVHSTTTDPNLYKHTAFCGTPSNCTYTLPGVGNAANDHTGDNSGDWDTTTVFDKTKGKFTINGQHVFSPLYNAVIFIRGNLPTIAGNLSTLNYNSGSAQASIAIDDDAAFDLNATWRVTIIATGNIGASGTVNINPPSTNSNYRWALVAGRDLEIGGNTDTFDCSSTNCDVLPSGTLPTFAGAILAHEQINFHGTPGINGYVIAEDRAACSSAVNQSESDVAGHPQIHYDCVNPSDPWAALSVRMQNWEESQRIQ